MFKYLVALGSCFFLFQSIANADAIFSETAHQKYKGIFLAGLGFTPGGPSLSGDYEYPLQRVYSGGAFGRFYSKRDDDNRSVPAVTILGGFMRPHVFIRNWDFYISGGFALIMISSVRGSDSTTTLGPNLAFGLLYQLTDSVAVGLENFKQFVWFNEDYRGLLLDELAVKLKIGF